MNANDVMRIGRNRARAASKAASAIALPSARNSRATSTIRIGVHMADRDLEALRQVAGVVRRATVDRVGREADLIVGDDVNRSADTITGEQRHIECLGDDAFTGERRVAVHDDRQYQRLVARVWRRTADALPRARDALRPPD